MARRRQQWQLIVRYVADECSEREEAEARALIAVDEDAGRLYDELRRLWITSPSAVKRQNTDAAWKNIDRKIEQNADVFSLADARVAHRRRHGMRGARRLLRMAAVFIIVVIGAVIAVQLTPERNAAVRDADFQIYATKKGERSTVDLADGSRVFLNAGSKLTVPSDFGIDTRDVHLEGQAYFQVKAMESPPFLVRTELATVQVTGTEFDVDAYPDADQMQVVVATGEVHVRSSGKEEGDPIVLRPRDIGLVLQAGGQLVRRNVDVRRYLAWKEGRLLFDNDDFKDVASGLERWYDLEIELAQPSRRVDGLTATFRDEPIDEVLGVISMALNLNYSRDGKKVTFYQP